MALCRSLQTKEGEMVWKHCSRKALRVFAVAGLTLVWVCLYGGRVTTGAAFDSTQVLSVRSYFPGNLFQLCSYNVNTQDFSCFPATTAEFQAVVFPFGVNTFRVYYLYDHNQAR